MNKSEAVIQFVGYRVANILYNCAPEFEFPRGEVSYKYNFSKSFVSLSEKEIQENVIVNVFYGEEDIEKAPYRLTVEIAGRFSCEFDWQPQWEANILAILFPYLRAMVSNITSSTGREPIILPTINIANLFDLDACHH